MTYSVGLTIVANVAIATGPTFLGAPQSFVLNLFFSTCNIRRWMPEANSYEGGPIFYTCYTETLFAESKSKFSFCLGISICVKVHFTQ